MANTKKPEEKEALATTRSLDDQIGCSLEARPETIAEGGVVVLMACPMAAYQYHFEVEAGTVRVPDGQLCHQAYWDTEGLPPSSYEAKVTITLSSSSPSTRATRVAKTRITVVPRQVQASVTLQRSGAVSTKDQALWVAIRNRTQAISFNRYHEFIDRVLCEGNPTKDDYGSPSFTQRRMELEDRPTIHGVDAYGLLRLATEAFLIFECGLLINDGELFDAEAESRRLGQLGQPVTLGSINTKLGSYLTGPTQNILPYLDRIVTQIVGISSERRVERLPYCEAILRNRLTCPSLLELIWSYWHEEGMLAQTLNTIALRFQNRRSHARDPLANLELDPLRPLNNLLWGFIQDEYSRLSVQRRAYEYDHHYGFSLVGKAISDFRPADSRSKFLEAFHNLLYRTAIFYREDDDTTIIADAFALLNALRDVHIILAEGAHNQFGDLPWTARKEMLIMQWLLARPEIKEFLRGRYMVPY